MQKVPVSFKGTITCSDSVVFPLCFRCVSVLIAFLFSYATPAQDRDYLALHVIECDGSVIPAVGAACAVVAQDEHTVLRHDVRIGDSLLRVGGEKDFAALDGAVDEQGAGVVHRDDIALSGDDPSNLLTALCRVNDDIVFAVGGLQPVGDHQVSGLDSREHLVIGRLSNQQELCQQQPADEYQYNGPAYQASVPSSDLHVHSAAADDPLCGLRFSFTTVLGTAF